MTEEFGIIAEEGVTYETKGAMLFREAEYERKINGKAQSIMIYEQKGDYTPIVWESVGDPSREEIATVPAGCLVRVIAAPGIGATATFTRE
jgi:hypothetical protein